MGFLRERGGWSKEGKFGKTKHKLKQQKIAQVENSILQSSKYHSNWRFEAKDE